MFSESVTWSSSCFTNVYLFAISASYAVDDIDGGVREVISDLNGYIGSRHFLYSDMVKENLYPRAKSLYLSVDIFFSLACVALFSLCSSCWILGFRFFFVLTFSLVERTFPRIGREFLSTRLGKGSMLRSIGRRHDRMGMHLNEVRKLWISLEAKYSRFVF